MDIMKHKDLDSFDADKMIYLAFLSRFITRWITNIQA